MPAPRPLAARSVASSAAGLALAVFLAGCGSAPAAATAPSTSPAASSPLASLPDVPSLTAVPTTPAPDVTPTTRPSLSPSATGPAASWPSVARVVSAAGVRQWISCAGKGSLTVVVVAGLGAWSSSWAGVLPSLRAQVRTCVYDRPGLGRSPQRPGPASRVVDAGLHAAELWALLRAAGERGPYVVLGHSYGGLVARAFVRAHRSSVAGVLLAEGVPPEDPTLGRYWHEAGHAVDMPASSAATGGGPRLGSKPLLVMSASAPDRDHLDGPTYGQPAYVTTLWVREQAASTGLSSDAVQVVAHSGHVLQQDDPAAVVAGVRVLLAAVRTHARLTCSYPWTSVRATCR